MKKHKTYLFPTILMLLAAALAATGANPGTPDTTFGTGGFSQRLLANLSEITDIAIDDNGAVIAVGRASSDFLLTRIGGFPGDVTTDFSAGTDTAGAVEIQNDGRIVVAGVSVQNNARRIAIARYNPNGTLDATFGTGGRVVLAASFVAPLDIALKIQPDGKYVFNCQINNQLGVVRLLSTGALDTSFDGDGAATTNLGTTLSTPYDLTLQPDGRIVVVGARNLDQDSFVLRYTANGALDTSFNGTGFRIVDFSAGQPDYLRAVALQPDGKIVAAGRSNLGTVVTRLTVFGAFDPTFAGSGTIAYDLDTAAAESATSVHPLPDGNIVLVSASLAAPRSLVVIRLNGGGIVDPGFGQNGVLRNTRSTSGELFAVEVTGTKLTAGFRTAQNAFGIERYNLARQASAGSDYDGDGLADAAVFRPATGEWFVFKSSDNTTFSFLFGSSGDVPIDGDYDGDGKSDATVFRPSNGSWFFLRSTNGTTFSTAFGNGTDKPLAGDFDRDGKSDIAVFRPASGEWLVLRSNTGFSNFFSVPFGLNGDVPISSERK